MKHALPTVTAKELTDKQLYNKGEGRSKIKKRGKGETPPAVCWERVADSFISENFPVRDLYVGICRQVTL